MLRLVQIFMAPIIIQGYPINWKGHLFRYQSSIFRAGSGFFFQAFVLKVINDYGDDNAIQKGAVCSCFIDALILRRRVSIQIAVRL